MQDCNNHMAGETAVSSLMIFEVIEHSLVAVLDRPVQTSAVHFLVDRRLLSSKRGTTRRVGTRPVNVAATASANG